MQYTFIILLAARLSLLLLTRTGKDRTDRLLPDELNVS